MSLVDLLALGLPLTPLVNWPVFAVLFLAARRSPGVRALLHVRWMSFLIAVFSTVFALLALAYFSHFDVDGTLFAVVLTLPIYAMTAINAVFLFLTWRGKW